MHSAYGGVFPTLAKREHGKNLVPLLHKLFIESEGALTFRSDTDGSAAETGSKARADFDTLLHELKDQNPDLVESFAGANFFDKIPNIDRIAVTEGPGLEPALWVGINFARLLGVRWNIPVIPVNHMEGHIVGSLLCDDVPYGSWQTLKELPLPAVALLISGGHTELIRIDALQKYEIIGQTKDDAVGEAFDKAARLLGLPYPGGPHISKLAHEAWEQKIPSPLKLPRPMINSGDLDFSFSGLKTAVLYVVRANSAADGSLTENFKKGLAREFEQAVSETLDAKLRAAIEKVGARAVIVGGGVSANHVLRKRFTTTAAEFGIPLYLPSAHISGDNALMIALAGALGSHKNGENGNTSRALTADGTKRLGLI